MSTATKPERIQTVVIGGGQSGLSVGYHLKRAGLEFVILEANTWIGDNWRQRRDSLRLDTPARYNGLVGMPFPAPATSFPTKNEMADYLEAYARRFQIGVRTRVRVERLSRRGRRFLIETNHGAIEAEQVIVAMANYQKGKVPAFASQLDSQVLQMHSADYRRPSQLREGPVLVVGAGSSGAEIALEVARHGHRTIVSGRSTAQPPFSVASFIGRHVIARLSKAGPLVRVRAKNLAAAGVGRVGRTVGVSNGKPMLEGGRVLDVANVIWCTGFEPSFPWIDLPDFEGEGQSVHRLSPSTIHGVAREAEHVARAVVERVRAQRTAREERRGGGTSRRRVRGAREWEPGFPAPKRAAG